MFKKIILSRIKKTTTELHPFEIFEQLNQTYQNTFNYIISIEGEGCWIGATPETLIEIDKGNCKTVSIAGTKSKSDNWGEKEINEQLLVTEFIADELDEFLIETNIKGPYTITAGAVEHLKTDFSGELSNISSWSKLLERLHPTPATCGIPKLKALTHIQTIELHQRKFYTGYLGPINSKKKELFVNLRCMEIQGKNAFLYLGGGITAQSIALDEWTETENKSKTLLNVIQQESK